MGFNIGLTKPAARALRPVIPDNARGLCITAAAGPLDKYTIYRKIFGLYHHPAYKQELNML